MQSVKIFRRVTHILRNEYHTLTQALYEGGFKPKDEEIMAKLEMLRMMKETAENPIVIDNDDEEDSLSAPMVLEHEDEWFDSLFDDEAV